MTIIDIFVADIQLWLQFWHYLYKEDYVGHFLSIFQEYCTIVVVYANVTLVLKFIDIQRVVWFLFSPPTLCFEWGFTRTFPGNQDVAVK